MVPAALTYGTVRCYGMPAALVTSVAQASFLACRSPWQPLVAVLAAGVVNLVGDLTLVCGLGRGIGGAAWATVASQAGPLIFIPSVLFCIRFVYFSFHIPHFVTQSKTFV